MTILVVILHVFVCLFLIVVILLQAGRGQGLSWGVFGGNPQSILGTKTASFLTRLTTGCAIVFLFTCIGLNIIETRKSRSLFGTQQAPSQIDFSKLKEALDKEFKTEEKSEPPSAEPAKQTEQAASQPSPNPAETAEKSLPND